MKSLFRSLKDGVRELVRPGGRARHYLPASMSVEAFFRELASRNVRYVVLRWFETLPDVAPGEDIDLLVADDDLEKLDDLFVRSRSGRACDVYSVTGLPGSDFRKMAYYPPHLSEGVIANRVLLRGLFRVPNPPDHFLSLAYHALYHKGYRSGLASATAPPGAAAKRPDHDYGAVLGALAKDLGLSVATDMESLDAHLASQGWRPPIDMLARLALRNPWIHDRFFSKDLSVEPRYRGIAVFLLRERALQSGRAGQVEEQLAQEGFEILEAASLGEQRRKESSLRLRGGNWGRGPWPVSGGLPARLIVAWDPRPSAVDSRTRAKYPLLSNGRILRAKERIRDLLMQDVPRAEQFNPLHSSDNDVQSWEYLEILAPDRVSDLREAVAARNAGHPRKGEA